MSTDLMPGVRDFQNQLRMLLRNRSQDKKRRTNVGRAEYFQQPAANGNNTILESMPFRLWNLFLEFLTLLLSRE